MLKIKKQSYIEKIILDLIVKNNLPVPELEYRFHPVRKWRFDFAYPAQKIAIECEGAIWAMGRHTRGSGYSKDCEKYNCAAVMGWRILKYTTENYNEVVDDLQKILFKKRNLYASRPMFKRCVPINPTTFKRPAKIYLQRHKK